LTYGLLELTLTRMARLHHTPLGEGEGQVADVRFAPGEGWECHTAKASRARRLRGGTFDGHLVVRRLLAIYVMLAPLLARRRIVLCPFRRLTGHRCPLCGLTRSLAALSEGEVRMSVAHHPLGVAVAAGTTASALVELRGITALVTERRHTGRTTSDNGTVLVGRVHRR
jgi:hypothetical protein